MQIIILHQFHKIFGVAAVRVADDEFSCRDKFVAAAGETKDAAEKIMFGRLSDQQLFF
jgi:hypothetical protein